MTKSSHIVVGFWRRLFADFLDALLLGIACYGIGYQFRYTLSAMGANAIGIGLVCCLLYYGLQHTRLCDGQTLGKRLLGIQVLRRDGRHLGIGKSFLRYLVVSFVFYNGIYGSFLSHLRPSTMMAVGSVYFLVVVWAFFACFLMIPLHPIKRGLHDIAANSVVVYKGCFDDKALNRLEDATKEKRAWIILTIGSVVLAGGLIWGAVKLAFEDIGHMSKLAEIQQSLAPEYGHPQVIANNVNGKAESLSVVIYIPLETFENKTERERIRREVFTKVKMGFSDLDGFGKLKVVLSSGFNIGIASFNTSD